MTPYQPISCVLPWKALFMDERDGHLSALPCCANWINQSFGSISDGSSMEEIWNGLGAQHIRRLMIEGRQDEMCQPDCPWLVSGRFTEEALRIVAGPNEFEENQRLNHQEIKERRIKLKSRPRAVRVIPTFRCNIRCRMCHQDHDADLQLPEQFMADVRAIGPYLYDYQLHGGEVLITRRFSEWADPEWLARNPQLLLSLVTNATKLPKLTWNILSAARINYITVSVNAANRDTYRYIAEANLFDEVIQNVKRLRTLSRNHPLRTFDLFVSFVIMRCNYSETADFVRLANNLDVPFRLLLVTGNRQGESIYTDPPILQKVLDSVIEAEPLAREDSLQEVVRVRDSLVGSLRSGINRKPMKP